jgi:hypothetical protein
MSILWVGAVFRTKMLILADSTRGRLRSSLLPRVPALPCHSYPEDSTK